MLLNLSRSLHFNSHEKKYHTEYMFTKEVIEGGRANDICLVMEMSQDLAKTRQYKIAKPVNTLYLSNEEIERMVQEETVSYYDK